MEETRKKRCTKCKDPKYRFEFLPFSNVCKLCQNERSREWYRNNKDDETPRTRSEKYYLKRYGKNKEEILRHKQKLKEKQKKRIKENKEYIDHTQQNSDHRALSYVGMNHKKCQGDCGRIKHIEEFHLTSRKYEGITYKYRRAKCKECRNLEKREKNKKRKEYNARNN